MKTRSLILHPHEVRAALAGTLGLVVRPVMPTVKGCKVGAYVTQTPNGLHVEPVNVQEDGDPWDDIPCPFGVPGDRLIGKETWRVGAWRTYEDAPGKFAFDYQASPELFRTPWVFALNEAEELALRRQVLVELRKKHVPVEEGNYRWEPGKAPLSWHAPATMPAWASRITLEVRGVRCVGTDDLSYADACKCGFPDGVPGALAELRRHWNARYAKGGLGWDANPWVWAAQVVRVA